MKSLDEVLKVNAELETTIGIDSTREYVRLVRMQQYKNLVDLVENAVIEADRFQLLTKNLQKFKNLYPNDA